MFTGGNKHWPINNALTTLDHHGTNINRHTGHTQCRTSVATTLSRVQQFKEWSQAWWTDGNWIKFLILVTRHTLPSSQNTTSPQGPRIHLPVTYFLFRDTTFHLVLALSASLRPKYGTRYLFTSANPKHTLPSDVILRRTTLFQFQPISPPSSPCNAQWILFRDFGAI